MSTTVDVWNLDTDASESVDVEEVEGNFCGDESILKTITKKGEAGGNPPEGAAITCHYVGTLLDGTKFDSSRDRSSPFNFTLGSGVIEGWSEGVATMKKGEIADFTIRSHKAYGDRGSPPKIPGGATLKFEIELISWEADGTKDVSKAKDGGVMKSMITPGTVQSWINPKALGEAVCNVKFKVQNGDVVLNTKEEGGTPLKFTVGDGEVLRGIDEAVLSMSEGEIARFEFTPSYGYGIKGDAAKNVAPHSPLVGVIELVGFTNLKDSYKLEDDERIEQANTMRQQGNDKFKAKQFKQAIARYNYAIEGIGAHFVKKEPEKLKEANNSVLPCYLNKAACLLKLDQNASAKECCEKALFIDANNVKALYRLGCSFTALGDWDAAVQNLKQCLTLDKNNGAATAAFKKVKALIAAQSAKEKKMFGGMFDKMAANDAKKEEKRKQEEPAVTESEPTSTSGSPETKDFSEKFLAENKVKEGVVTLPSGLQYKVIRAGNGGGHPLPNSPCECHYEGRCAKDYPAGKKFDSSYDRGSPTTFAPNQVIKGWTEAMQLMVEGDKWEMYIPSDLACGDNGRVAGCLVFTMEIIKINGGTKPKVKNTEASE